METLWERVREGGLFVYVEQGSPKGFRFLSSFRNWIIEKPREEASIVAPCPHHGECPLLSKTRTWCHFSQLSTKLPNDVFPKLRTERLLVSEKFCYLVVRKGLTPNTKGNSEEAKSAEEKSFFWPRMIRPVIKKQRHLLMDLCTPEAEI